MIPILTAVVIFHLREIMAPLTPISSNEGDPNKIEEASTSYKALGPGCLTACTEELKELGLVPSDFVAPKKQPFISTYDDRTGLKDDEESEDDTPGTLEYYRDKMINIGKEICKMMNIEEVPAISKLGSVQIPIYSESKKIPLMKFLAKNNSGAFESKCKEIENLLQEMVDAVIEAYKNKSNEYRLTAEQKYSIINLINPTVEKIRTSEEPLYENFQTKLNELALKLFKE